jgi:hypothetical protein
MNDGDATVDDDSDAVAEDGNDGNASTNDGEATVAPAVTLPARCAILPD